MHLLRIQVPDFRVLKDVDITFEKEFSPRIFPLGSQNGGGKSTLLQFVFVLSHCSGEPERLPFLRNMLSGFRACENETKKVLATMDIWDGEKEVRMEFFSCRDSYLKELVNDEDGVANSISSDLSNQAAEDRMVESNISKLKQRVCFLRDISEKLKSIKTVEDDKERNKRYAELILSKYVNIILELSDDSTIHECERRLEEEISRWESEIEGENETYRRLSSVSGKLRDYLQSEHLIYITQYSANEDEKDEKEVLLCKIESLDTNEAESFLRRLSEKIFLAAPFTQVYLFLPQHARKFLFGLSFSDRGDYYSHLKEAKCLLPFFFTYDFFPADILIRSLKAARDQDIRDVMETGTYGNRFKPFLDDLNALLTGKRLRVEPDFSKASFETYRDGEAVELYPEDLSHGELRRLSLYTWIKQNKIEDAIVLMDEIETALHPDWQYQIVRDLMQWTPSNQYILATHSSDLCEALTPAHVKELEPETSETGTGPLKTSENK